jgi:tripartite motif-containing protein 71
MGERPPSFVTKWGQHGERDGRFISPMGVAVDSSGNVYVADLGMERIQKFDSDGTFITKWGSGGIEDGSSMSLQEWP